MKVTEKEAKHMACPVMRSGTGLCMGENCMAWRWSNQPDRSFVPCVNTGVPYNAPQLPEPETRPDQVPKSYLWGKQLGRGMTIWYGWIESGEAYMSRRKGYCGMAGEINEL